VENLSHRDNVIYAEFIDSNSTIVAHSNKDVITTKETDDNIVTAITNQEKYSALYNNEGNKVYEVLVPVNLDDKYIGSLKVVFSMDETFKAINRNIYNITLIGILLFIVLGFILLSISKGIAKSL
ncbi:MAG TPA: hypothetical protein DCG60_04430, partial [Tissierella sp.]|nr:hypothetical protein [Tissierella sp.]